MTHTLVFAAFLALLWPSEAYGQDDTAEAPVEDTGAVMAPADSVVKFPDGTEQELLESTLLVPLTVPSLSEGILKLPSRSIVLSFDGGVWRPHTLPGKYWLMPDSYYREALVKARQLPVYEGALDRCTETSLDWQRRTYDALEECSDQFGRDDDLIAEQVQTIATLESQVASLTYQRDNARRQRNVAWAITGGLVLGAATVITVAVAP